MHTMLSSNLKQQHTSVFYSFFKADILAAMKSVSVDVIIMQALRDIYLISWDNIQLKTPFLLLQ